MDHSKMGHNGEMDMNMMTGMMGSDMMHTMDSGMDMDHSAHMMKMYFHVSTSATILFQKWSVSTVGGMIGSCIAVFVIAMLYEGLKVLREALLRQSAVNVRYQSTEFQKTSTSVLTETHQEGRSMFFSWAHILQTFLHIVQVTVSYFLMLIFMTYNVYLCIAVAVGAGCGYFLFGWRRSIIIDINEHCH